MKQMEYLTIRTTLLDRITRALALLGLIGAILTIAQGINGIIGVIVIIAVLDGLIQLTIDADSLVFTSIKGKMLPIPRTIRTLTASGLASCAEV